MSISIILTVFDLDLFMLLVGLQTMNWLNGRTADHLFKSVCTSVVSMAFENLDAFVRFLVGLLISTVVIYVVTFFMRQRRSVKLAFFAAIIGSIVYYIAFIALGHSFLSAVLGGIAWLLALKAIYRMGWLKALIVAVTIWIITTFVGEWLPTALGPL